MERALVPIGYEPEDYVPEPAPAQEAAPASAPAPVEPRSTAPSTAPAAEPEKPVPAQPAEATAPAPAAPATPNQPVLQGHKLTPIGYAPAPGVDPIGSGNALTRRLIGSSIDVKNNFADAIEGFDALRDPHAKIDFTPRDPTGYEAHVGSVGDVDWTSPSSIATWVGEQLGGGVPQLAPGIIAGGGGGVAGAAIGGVTAGPAGAVAGGWVGRELGAAGMSYVQNFGDVWSGFKEDKGIAKMLKDGKVTPQQLARAAAGTAVLVAGLDVVSLNKLTGKTGLGFTKGTTEEVKKWAIKQVAKRLAEGAATEGATEWAQSIIAQAAEIGIGGNWDLPHRALRSLDEFFGGVFAGGPAAVVTGHPEEQTPPPPAPGADTPPAAAPNTPTQAPPKPDDQPEVAATTLPEGTPSDPNKSPGLPSPGDGKVAPSPADANKQATPEPLAQPESKVGDVDLGVALTGGALPTDEADAGIEEAPVAEEDDEEADATTEPATAEAAAQQTAFMKQFLAGATQTNQDLKAALAAQAPAKPVGIPDQTTQVAQATTPAPTPQVETAAETVTAPQVITSPTTPVQTPAAPVEQPAKLPVAPALQEQVGTSTVPQEPVEVPQEPAAPPPTLAPAPASTPQTEAVEKVPTYTPIGYEPEDATPTEAAPVAPAQQVTETPVEARQPAGVPESVPTPEPAPTPAAVAPAATPAPTATEAPKPKITLKGVIAKTAEELAAKVKPKGKKFQGRVIGPEGEVKPGLTPAAPTSAPTTDRRGLTKAQRDLEEDVHKNLPPELESHPFASEAIETAIKEDKSPVRPADAAKRQEQVAKVVQSAVAHSKRLAAEDQARAKATEEAELKRAQEEQRKRETEGKPQEKKRRGKTKGKAAEDVALESDKRRNEAVDRERAKPEAEQDPDIIEYGRYRDARNKLAARDPKRKGINQLMDEAWQRHVETLRKAEAAKAPAPASTTTTLEAGLSDEEKAKQAELARAKTAQERRPKTEAALKPIVDDFKLPDSSKDTPTGRSPKSLAEYARDLTSALSTFVRQAKSALAAEGLSLQEKAQPGLQSPEETLAIFANKLLHRKSPGGLDAVEFASAVALYRAGDFAKLEGLVTEGTALPGSGAWVDSTHKRSQGAMPIPDLPASSTIPAPTPTLAPTPAPTPKPAPKPAPKPTPKAEQPVTFTDKHTKKEFTVTPLQTLSGTEALQRANKANDPLVIGAFKLLRKMHMRALKRLVGDVPVLIVSRDDMARIAKSRSALGLYMPGGPRRGTLTTVAAGTGQRIILVSEETLQQGEHRLARTIIHEMTHAAADYTLDRDINGTKQIVHFMRTELIKQLKANGHYSNLDPNQTYGLTDDWEFITEAFSNPSFQKLLATYQVHPKLGGIIGASMKGIQYQTWWGAFCKMISNALGIHVPAGQSYFEQLIALHPQLMMSSFDRLSHIQTHLPAILRGVKTFARPEQSGIDSPIDERMLQSVNQSFDAARQAVEDRWMNTSARGVKSTLATTYELIRRSAGYFGGPDNPFASLGKLLLSARSLRNRLAKPGLQLVKDQLWFKVKHRQEYNEMQDVVHESTLLGVDPRMTLADNIKAKNISKAGELDEHKRAEFPALKTRYDAMSQRAKDMFDRTVTHHTNQENQRRTQFTSNALQQITDHYGITLPTSHDQAVADIMDGVLDADPKTMTDPARQAKAVALRAALGKHADALGGVGVLKRVKGVYVPLMRWGKYVISATLKVSAPPGGAIDPKNPNQILFHNKADYKAYVKNPGHQIDRVISEWWDPVTGKKTQKKASVQHTPGGPLTDPIQVFRVHVMNRVVEMDDNMNKLRKRREELIKAGYEVSQVAEHEQAFDRNGDIMPSEIKRLMNAMDNSAVGGATVGKKANINALSDAYVRTLMGSRAQHRRLKRMGVQGFARDIAEATNSANHIMTGHIANLMMAPKLATADKALQDYIEAGRKDYGKFQRDTLERQSMARELRNRITRMQTRSEEHWGSNALRGALDLSFLIHLASPAYTIINLAQPLVTTAPVLSAKFGIGRTIKHMTMANWDMGAVRTVGRGVAETGREAINSWRKMPIEQYDHHEWAVNRISQVEPDALGAMELLDQRGLGASGGIEAPEVGEMGKGLAGIALGRTVRIARAMPEAAEAVNRYTTLLAAWRAARESGMSIAEANEFAVSTVEQTQGGYATENNPNIMDKGILKLPFQFKKYSLMFGQLYYGALLRTLGPGSTREERVHAAKQTAYLSAMTMAFAGVGGLPFMELGRAFVLAAAALPGDDEPWKWDDYENGMETWFKHALKWALGDYAGISAESIMHGATRLIGIDTSSRMGNESMVLFGDPKKMDAADVKAWLFDLLGGAAVSSVANTIQSGSAILDGDLSKLPAPKFFTDVVKAYQKYAHGTKTASGRKVGQNYTLTEAIEQGLGFRPRKAVRPYEAGGSGTKFREDERNKAARTSLMGDWAGRSPSARNAFFLTKIAAWNRHHPDMKITKDSLEKSLYRRKQQAEDDKKARQMAN